LLVETGETRLLIDTSPDMREQLNAANVGNIDAVIWTHDHADHTHGIDDLRQIYHARGEPVPGYARPETLHAVTTKFRYVFAGNDGYPPTVAGAPLPDEITIGDLQLRVADQPHGAIQSAGLRFERDGKSAGYATDFNDLTDEMKMLYQGLDLWIVDALRVRPHPSHPTLDQVIGWADLLRPKRTVLMHMDQSMDYRSLCNTLPDGIEPGYDGMEIQL
jgi:phosphoribosyl 1,2-cyclic phosphate phosphodiesterase